MKLAKESWGQRLLAPLQARLENRVALAVAVPAVVFIGVALVISNLLLTQQIKAGVEANYHQDLALRAERISGVLTAVTGSMSTLAHNSTVANGLIDSIGRETYLAPLLGGFRNVLGMPVQIMLADFLGGTVASNVDDRIFEPYRAWIQATIEAGETQARIVDGGDGGQMILVVDVIVYMRTHSGEGALVYMFPLQPDILIGDQGRVPHLLLSAHRSPSVDEMLARGGFSESVAVPAVLAPLGLQIAVQPDFSAVDSATRQTSALLALGGSILLALVLLVAHWSGKRLALPLRNLAENARRIGDDLWSELPASGDRNDEIGVLDNALRAMLSRLRDLYRTLEARVEERTRQLNQAKDEAEHANSAKSDFLSAMSHELRTPLNAVLGFAQLMEMDPHLDSGHRASVEQILGSGKHLLALVTQLLDLARIESGIMELTINEVRVMDVIDECVSMMAPVALRQQIDLRMSCAAKAGLCVYADATRLRQCLLNLISNAIKYNKPGGMVSIECDAGETDELRILVRDNGIGIPPERAGDLFQKFSRLGREASSIEGAGIGLALTRHIMHLMSGEVGFESVEGQGSTFWLNLRRVAGIMGVSTALQGNAVRGVSSRQAADQEFTVLYVEDNPVNLMLVERVLELRPGVRLISAHNAGLGREMARVHRPALVLLDIQLPDKSGYELLAELRQLPETAAIPVVALSAAAMPAEIERAVASGFYAYLTKPLRINELLAIVDQLRALTATPLLGSLSGMRS